MKRAIWIIVIVLITAYLVNSYLENRAKRQAEKAEAERIEKTIRDAVAQLVERINIGSLIHGDTVLLQKRQTKLGISLVNK